MMTKLLVKVGGTITYLILAKHKIRALLFYRINEENIKEY